MSAIVGTRGEPGILPGLIGHLVDDRVGIVNSVFEVQLQTGAPAFFHVFARACNTGTFTQQENFFNTGGAASDRGRAVAKAVGEAVERYCAAIFDVDELPLFTYQDAPVLAVAPSEFALYSPEQYAQPGFPWVPFQDDTPVRWATALDLTNRQPCLIPACRVFMPYHYYLGSGDAPVEQPISTGMACQVSPAAAALAGICEVIERDAFTICWQAMLSPPQIRLDTLDDENYDLVQRFERARGSVTMFDLTLDHGIPTILSVLRGEPPTAPAFVFAAASSPSPRDAARKSLEEVAHTRRYSQWIQDHMDVVVPDAPCHHNVTDQQEHLRFATDHGNSDVFEFLYESTERIVFDDIIDLSSGDPRDEVEALVDRVHSVGERVLVADLTTPDVRDLGLPIVRAVIPGFHPLHMGHQLRSLGGRRLWEVPQALGYKGITTETGDNPAPHPYP